MAQRGMNFLYGGFTQFAFIEQNGSAFARGEDFDEGRTAAAFEYDDIAAIADQNAGGGPSIEVTAVFNCQKVVKPSQRFRVAFLNGEFGLPGKIFVALFAQLNRRLTERGYYFPSLLTVPHKRKGYRPIVKSQPA